MGAACEVGVGTGRRMITTVEKQEKAVQEMSNREIEPLSRRPNGVRLFHISVIEDLVINFDWVRYPTGRRLGRRPF